MIKELYSTGNDLIVLSVMLVFSPGMFASRSRDDCKVLCQTGNVFEVNKLLMLVHVSGGQTCAQVPVLACANWCFDRIVCLDTIVHIPQCFTSHLLTLL